MASLLTVSCLTVAHEGLYRFRLAAAVPERGSLPGPEVFVFRRGTAPKADVFLRVGSVAELTALSRGRQASEAAGSAEYLSASLVQDYDTLTQALVEKEKLVSRVDGLVKDWELYLTDFVNGSWLLPRVEPTQLQAARDAYYAAAAQKAAKEAARVAAVATLATAEAQAAAAADEVSEARTRAADCSRVGGAINLGLAAVQALRTAVSGFLTTARATSGLPAGFSTQLDVLAAALAVEAYEGKAVLQDAVADMTAACSALAAGVPGAEEAQALADAAVGTSKTALAVAQAEAAAATAAAAAALDTVLAYCPDFVP